MSHLDATWQIWGAMLDPFGSRLGVPTSCFGASRWTNSEKRVSKSDLRKNINLVLKHIRSLERFGRWKQVFHSIVAAKQRCSGSRESLRKLIPKGVPKLPRSERKTFRDQFVEIWGARGEPKFRIILRLEKVDLTSNKLGNLRPEGHPRCILGTGPAECEDPAEALELASS